MLASSRLKLVNHLILLSLCVLISIISFYFLMNSLNKGFDITDESYYLLSITQPKNKIFELSHFGYELGTLFKLCGENLIVYRAAGVFILLFLSFIFTITVNQYFPLPQRPFKPLNILIITLSSLFYYTWLWLITPSYNWLNLFAMLLVGIGLFSYFKEEPKRPEFFLDKFLYPSLVGLGGALTFVSKPPSTVVLSVLVLFWCLYHFKKSSESEKSLYFLLISGLIGTLFILIHAFIYFGSFNNFTHDIIRSLHAAKVIGINSNLLMVFNKAIVTIIKNIIHPNMLIIIGLLSLVFIIHSIVRKFIEPTLQSKIQNLVVHFYMFSSFFVLIMEIFNLYIKDLYLGYNYKILNIDPGTAMFIFIIIFFVSYIFIFFIPQKINFHTLSCNNDNFFKNNLFTAYKNSNKFVISIFLFLTSIAYAIGTNNNLVFQMFAGSIFAIAGIFIMLSDVQVILKNNFYHYLMCLVISIFLVLGCYHGYLHPYRLGGGIKEQNYPLHLLNSKYNIYVDKKTYNYFNKLESYARAYQWKANSSLIDLTGDSVGALVALNARVPGVAWFIGGYSGSNAYVDHVLNQMPKELLKNAWVLTSENGRIKTQSKIYNKKLLAQKYIAIATLENPYKNELQILWKPKKNL